MIAMLLSAAGLVLLLAVLLPVLFGPPYLPTLKPNVEAALDLLDLKPGQTVLDIGSGDGRVLLAAAERGYKAVGIELSPVLVIVARIRTWKYRKQVRVLWGNYFQRQWPPADALFGFIIPYQMERLDAVIEAWHTKPIRMASFAFEIPGREPIEQKKGVYLYEYK
jgi:SAM-dependent methyltransferase